MIFIENKGTLHTSVFQKNNRQKGYICARECPGVLWWLTFLRIIHSYNLNDPEGLFPSCSCVQSTAMADFSQCSVTSSKWKMTSSFFASTLYISFGSCIYIGVDQCTLTQVLHHRRFFVCAVVQQTAIKATSSTGCHCCRFKSQVSQDHGSKPFFFLLHTLNLIWHTEMWYFHSRLLYQRGKPFFF